MAHLFQMESVRLSWLQQKSTLSFHCDHHQSSFSWPALLQHQRLSSSLIFCLSSNTQPDSRTTRATSGSKRYARAIIRDTQLRKDLQLFLSSQGLPLDKVPSTKELSNRGREDLAKSVRRRGYKAVQALLADSDPEPSTAHVINTVHNVEDSVRKAPVRDLEPSTAHVSNAVHNFEDSVREDLEAIPLAAPSIDEQLLTKSGTPTDTGQVVELSLDKDSTVLQEGVKSETALKTTIFSNGSLIEEQAEENLRMRAAEFVRTGRLDQVPDSDEEEEDDDDDDNEFLEDSSDEEKNIGLQDGQLSARDIAAEKAAKLRAKLLPFLKSNASGQPHDQVAESIFDSVQKLNVSEASTRIGSGSTSETDMELQKIKSALISKEKELSEVSRDLEETKAQLALVQAKATAEVAQAKQLALEKDIRLKSADLALANLKRVQVEYWGEGGRVELAGSFNGWKYFISMEPDPTSEIIKPDGSRGPMMWETELWLYPGVYEIKFIVDGNWQIDQRREIVMRNSLHNNLLRVEP